MNSRKQDIINKKKAELPKIQSAERIIMEEKTKISSYENQLRKLANQSKFCNCEIDQITEAKKKCENNVKKAENAIRESSSKLGDLDRSLHAIELEERAQCSVSNFRRIF